MTGKRLLRGWLWGTALSLGIGACSPQQRQSGAESVLLGCSLRDSTLERVLRFSDVTRSAGTGDLSGTEIHLKLKDHELAGEAVIAVGEFGPPKALTNITITSGGTLSFDLPKDRGVALFRGQVSCDSLWGYWEPFPTAVDSNKVFRRIP